jgi:type II secretory pathway component PulJ
VVKCQEYHEEKEAIKAAEEQAKLDRKIKRAANALRKKLEAIEKAKRAEERTAKAAEKQLAKDLATANKPAQKTRKEQPNGTITKAKKSAPIVSKEYKVANKARPHGKLLVRSAVVVPVEGEVALGVVVAKIATWSIKRPSRYI